MRIKYKNIFVGHEKNFCEELPSVQIFFRKYFAEKLSPKSRTVYSRINFKDKETLKI